MRIRIDGGSVPVSAEVIHTWRREELEQVSDSLTFRQMAATVFDQIPQASRVALVLVHGVPLMLVEAAGRWFDSHATPLRVTVERPSGSTSEAPA